MQQEPRGERERGEFEDTEEDHRQRHEAASPGALAEVLATEPEPVEKEAQPWENRVHSVDEDVDQEAKRREKWRIGEAKWNGPKCDAHRDERKGREHEHEGRREDKEERREREVDAVEMEDVDVPDVVEEHACGEQTRGAKQQGSDDAETLFPITGAVRTTRQHRDPDACERHEERGRTAAWDVHDPCQRGARTIHSIATREHVREVDEDHPDDRERTRDVEGLFATVRGAHKERALRMVEELKSPPREALHGSADQRAAYVGEGIEVVHIAIEHGHFEQGHRAFKARLKLRYLLAVRIGAGLRILVGATHARDHLARIETPTDAL